MLILNFVTHTHTPHVTHDLLPWCTRTLAINKDKQSICNVMGQVYWAEPVPPLGLVRVNCCT